MNCLCEICRTCDKVAETLQEINEEDQLKLLALVRDWLKEKVFNTCAFEHLQDIENLLAIDRQVQKMEGKAYDLREWFNITQSNESFIAGQEQPDTDCHLILTCKNCARQYLFTGDNDYIFLLNHGQTCGKESKE